MKDLTVWTFGALLLHPLTQVSDSSIRGLFGDIMLVLQMASSFSAAGDWPSCIIWWLVRNDCFQSVMNWNSIIPCAWIKNVSVIFVTGEQRWGNKNAAVKEGLRTKAKNKKNIYYFSRSTGETRARGHWKIETRLTRNINSINCQPKESERERKKKKNRSWLFSPKQILHLHWQLIWYKLDTWEVVCV